MLFMSNLMSKRENSPHSQQIVHVLTVVDGVTEEIVEVHDLPHFSLEEFVKQYEVDPVLDPEMHARYSVGPDDAPLVIKAMEKVICFEFSQFAYFIDAVVDDRTGTKSANLSSS